MKDENRKIGLWKLAFPFTLISFGTVTKWWYILPEDAPDTMYAGFPLPFIGTGWHTSGSYQVFVLEGVADFGVYFVFWLLFIYGAGRFLKNKKTSGFLAKCLWIGGVISILFTGFSMSLADNAFYLNRPYKIKVIKTGYAFVGFVGAFLKRPAPH